MIPFKVPLELSKLHVYNSNGGWINMDHHPVEGPVAERNRSLVHFICIPREQELMDY